LAFVTRQRTQLRFGTFPFCYGDVHLPLGARY
jgi:hypothetical protein